MLNIGITGSDGLIGYHLRVLLSNTSEIEIKLANRHTFSSQELLTKFTDGLDAIVHLADKNVGADDDIQNANMTISKQLTQACDTSQIKPHIVFASSTHIDLNPNAAYSKSKIECTNYLNEWSNSNNSKFTNLIIPHVFGEFGKPFYNSVISTFCHQLANGEKTKIIDDKKLDLLHAYDVANGIYQVILAGRTGKQKLRGSPISVVEARERLISLSEDYFNNIVPDITDNLNCQLFNTFRSYLSDDYYPRSFVLHSDQRGMLYEAVKSRQSGLTFLSTTRPGITRGNHYHVNKFERFIVTNGKAYIRFRKIFTEDVLTFEVDGGQPTYVDIPTYTTHNITNIGSDDLTTLFWSNVFYNEKNPDTYFEEV